MKENKFRAWDNVDFKMYYLGEEENIHFYFNSNGIMAERFINIKTVVVDEEIDDVHYEKLEHLKYMQYTGLKDKNGTEIFEGDILKIIGEADYSNYAIMLDEGWEFTGKVVFNQGTFEVIDSDKGGFSLSECLNCCDDVEIEIIGNIYEIGNF